MTSNLILGALFAAFVAFHFATERTHVKERARLVDALIARTTQEFVSRQKSAVEPETKREVVEPERIFAEGF